MSRTLSYSEISTALTCFAQWDFAYGGHLTGGDTLKPRQIHPTLSDGRAWGAAVASWHATGELWTPRWWLGHSLNADAQDQIEMGFEIDPEQVLDRFDGLNDILTHYMATAKRLPWLTMMEGELNVPVPSRGGQRGSNRYRFHCYLDGHTENDGHPWIVEFKLRANLTPLNIIERQPQYRWYALAYALATGTPGPVGVILDERLKAAPLPPRILKSGKVSHDKRQLCTLDEYLRVCAEHGEEPSDEAVGAFRARRWHQRHELIFDQHDLAEAREELRSAAKLIRDLDSGELHPIRNGKRGACQSCKFVGVCMQPDNHFLINSLYERTEPKRLRGPRPEGVR